MELLYFIRRFFLFILVCHWAIHQGNAQSYPTYDIPVYDKTGKLLPNTNAGGLKSPQFSAIDFNDDGIQDLFVFDRNANKVLPFIKKSEPGSIDYIYAPEYVNDFPKMIQWALVRDYNNDGVPDIFTCFDDFTIAGNAVAVYKGTRLASGRLSFELINPPNVRFRNVLNYLTPSNTYNAIFVNTIDMPVIMDLDDDGDLDIISFDSGGQYATFYKNVSLEEGLGIDAFKYVIADPCWGKFQEAQFNDELTLSSSPLDCSTGFSPGDGSGTRHSGTSLSVLDLNGDGLLDMLIGDIGSARMTALINGGTKDNAFITEKISDFPSFDEKATISDFVAAYHLDVDGDGKRDLIFTTNAVNNSENINHIWYYKNQGTDHNPNFTLIKRDFLIDQMPYFYSGSHPVFVDVNNDGLMDIIIGTDGILDQSKERKNRLIYLKNIGSKTAPQYQIEDDNYLNFGQFTDVQVKRLAPTFGDLNGDGALDLLVGTHQGGFLYSENSGLPTDPLEYNNIQGAFPYRDNSSPLFLVQNLKPQIFDANYDGLPDIVVGKTNRQLNLFTNQGTLEEPFFNMNNFQTPNLIDFGNYIRLQIAAYGNAAPTFFKSGDENLLLLGTDNAQLDLLHLGQPPYPETFQLIRRNVGNIYEGRNTVASVADIDDDGHYEIVVGNERGGIAFYKSNLPVGKESSTDSSPSVIDINIYPNPTDDHIYVESNIPFETIEIIDIQGQTVKKMDFNNFVSFQGIKKGIYIVRLTHSKYTINKKVVVIQ